MDYVILQKGKRDTETQRGEKEKKRARLRGVVVVEEVSLWMWSLKMLKCCVCCEHPSNGKSMMGRALRRSQGCYIKAEVLHQRFSGSKYWCLFGFVGLLNPFHWFLPLSLLEMPHRFLSCTVFVSTPTGLLLHFTVLYKPCMKDYKDFLQWWRCHGSMFLFST